MARNRTSATSRLGASPLDGAPPPDPARMVTRYLPGTDADRLAAPPVLKTRRPDPTPPPPVVLLTGDRGSGKTHEMAALASDPRVDRAFLVEWGEADADRYGPGVPWEIVDHDGSWADIVGQIRAAGLAAARTGGTCVLMVDGMASAWSQTLAWAHDRARYSVRGAAILASDPDAPVEVGFGGWQDAADRYGEAMEAITDFPGPVVLTARGSEAIEVDPASGNPTGRRIFKTEGHKHLEYDADAVIRLRNGAPPVAIKCTAPGVDLNPTTSGPREVPGFVLADLVFDILGGVGVRRGTRLFRDPTPGQLHHRARVAASTPPPPWEPQAHAPAPFDPATADERQWLDHIHQAPHETLTDLWRAAHQHGAASTPVLDAMIRRSRVNDPTPPPEQDPRGHEATPEGSGGASEGSGPGATPRESVGVLGRRLMEGEPDAVVEYGPGKPLTRAALMEAVRAYREAGGAFTSTGFPRRWREVFDLLDRA